LITKLVLKISNKTNDKRKGFPLFVFQEFIPVFLSNFEL